VTPAEEATFIALWNKGVETAAIAQQLGIKATTAQSLAYRLQQRGLIQPRPRGGAYPTQKAQARQEGAPAPVQRPVQTTDTGAVSSADTGADHGPAPLPQGQGRALEPVDLGCHSRRAGHTGSRAGHLAESIGTGDVMESTP
jgi:DNA-binding transcriptional MocR family regulator